MKFSEMIYERPNLEDLKVQVCELTEKLENASSYAQAKDAFLGKQQYDKHLRTLNSLTHIRHTIDTRDAFYEDENKFWNGANPVLAQYEQAWTKAMLASKFRPDFEAEYGDLMYRNAEISLKTFAPEIMEELKKENELRSAYEKLIASAQVPFAGKKYTLSQLTPYKNDLDDARRLAAWKAEGQWYKDHQEELDRLYDELVHTRDTMGKKLGYTDYVELGYYRMNRNCYTKKDVEKFRQAVVKYLVPLANDLNKEQAERLGMEFPMSFSDCQLEFRSGNAKPFGTPDEILAQGLKFYNELSPETSEFFNVMMNGELLDVLSTEGKAAGGYCTSLPDYNVPFIFANFNGTQHDVEVVTHEAGHAFAAYTNRNRIPMEYMWPTLEGCEVHSMSMEFFAWPWAKGFFGEDTRKFYYSHLASSLCFIPYGTMVDHFQHVVYENPNLTPKERHNVWKELLGVYMPWLRLDGDIPFYSEGEGWQRQTHIYKRPFYYIDYCLAQTVAIQFWAKIQEDQKKAWECYLGYTKLGGSDVFTELLKKSGLESPFDEVSIKHICDSARTWLEAYDLKGIE